MAINQDRFQTGFFFALFAGVLLLSFFIFLPYLYTLLMAGTIAILFWPIHRRILRYCGGRPNLAALVTMTLVCLLVITPLSLIGFQLIVEARQTYTSLTGSGPDASLVNTLMGAVERTLGRYLPNTQFDLGQYIGQGMQWLVGNLGVLFSSAVLFFVHTFLFLLALYFLFRDGIHLRSSAVSLSPMSDRDDARIFHTLVAAINSVVRGTLVMALIQGVLAGLGFFVFRVPNPVLWGAVTVIAALIPTMGTAIITVPAALYLFLTQQTLLGVGMLIWGITGVGLIDNLIRPLLIGKGIELHPFIILLAVLGGLNFFGPFGFILGPLVVALLLTLLRIYREYLSGDRGIRAE